MSQELRLAMLGMIPGNGHPFSWSAIINGYDPQGMSKCPYPGIIEYMGRQPLQEIGIPGAKVTHVWTDDPAEAPVVAEASLIPNVVADPMDVIGQVDAVVIATDDGSDHVRRARPFVEAGIPVFVDKPLATTLPELSQFVRWHREGKILMSSSGMRYAPEMNLDDEKRVALGDLRWITSFTCKTWERYGIHALEAVAPLLGRGFTTITCCPQVGGDVMTVHHESGVTLTLVAMHDAFGSFGVVHLYGTKGDLTLKMRDTYHAFRGQLVAWVDYLRTGVSQLRFGETVELMAVIIGGIRSREQGGRVVAVEEVLGDLRDCS